MKVVMEEEERKASLVVEAKKEVVDLKEVSVEENLPVVEEVM